LARSQQLGEADQAMPRWPKRKERPGMDRYGRTPLWYHCFNGDLEAASEAIAAGADPSFGDDVDYSPLHVAVQEGRLAVIRLLVASGADQRLLEFPAGDN
jgi:ankyrin repeat protein